MQRTQQQIANHLTTTKKMAQLKFTANKLGITPNGNKRLKATWVNAIAQYICSFQQQRQTYYSQQRAAQSANILRPGTPDPANALPSEELDAILDAPAATPRPQQPQPTLHNLLNLALAILIALPAILKTYLRRLPTMSIQTRLLILKRTIKTHKFLKQKHQLRSQSRQTTIQSLKSRLTHMQQLLQQLKTQLTQ